jgi:hypothetical protein
VRRSLIKDWRVLVLVLARDPIVQHGVSIPPSFLDRSAAAHAEYGPSVKASRCWEIEKDKAEDTDGIRHSDRNNRYHSIFCRSDCSVGCTSRVSPSV